MSGRRIGLVAWHVFKESIRDRVLYGIAGFALLLVASSILIGQITAGQDLKIIKDLGLATIEIAGALMTIFIGVGLVAREIDRRSIFALLAKPLPRWEFIAGKYLGLCGTLFVNVLIMGVGVSLALLYVKGSSLIGPSWVAIALIYFELMIVTSVAILFSSFSTPSLSALLTFLVFIIGHLSASLRDLAVTLQSKAAAYILEAIYFLLPNLSLFSFRTEAALGISPGGPAIIGALAYALCYIAIVLTVSIVVFTRRDFK